MTQPVVLPCTAGVKSKHKPAKDKLDMREKNWQNQAPSD